ncbi:MAG: adenine deaminase [Deltaproteobacteria bacterium]|nr:adenine deaminase [Deltaproteobacteria bacterium]
MGWKENGCHRTPREIKELVAVCKNEIPPDMILRGGMVINVHTGEILETDVAVKGERIAAVGNFAFLQKGDNTEIIDARGKYVTPGLIDPHYHSYHAQQNMTQFARLVLPHGTTALADSLYGPGMISSEAIRFFVEEYSNTPLKLIFLIPTITYLQNMELDLPRVFDTMSVDDMIAMLDWPECYGLEEPPADVMLATDRFPEMIDLFSETLRRNKVITGHAWGIQPQDLNGYIAAGVSSDHEGDTKADAIERARLGMRVLMREGSAAAAVRRLVRAVTEERLDPRFFSFSVDVGTALRFREQGHIDEVIRVAIASGLSPIYAVQMATLNAAEALGVARDMGSIAPGKFADILVVDDLPDFRISTVVANGKVVARDYECVVELSPPPYPDTLLDTIRVSGKIAPEDFRVEAPPGRESVEVRVIEVIEDSLHMPEGRADLKVRDGDVTSDTDQDVLKIAMFESFNGSGDRGKGFIRGFNLKRGAIASSHNSFFHGINVVGTNDYDMALAANAIAEAGGGEVVVSDGKVLALLELPLCGVLSADTLENSLNKSRAVADALKGIACGLKAAFRSLAFTTAVGNIGDLKIFEKGIIHVGTKEVLDPVIG